MHLHALMLQGTSNLRRTAHKTISSNYQLSSLDSASTKTNMFTLSSCSDRRVPYPCGRGNSAISDA